MSATCLENVLLSARNTQLDNPLQGEIVQSYPPSCFRYAIKKHLS